MWTDLYCRMNFTHSFFWFVFLGGLFLQFSLDSFFSSLILLYGYYYDDDTYTEACLGYSSYHRPCESCHASGIWLEFFNFVVESFKRSYNALLSVLISDVICRCFFFWDGFSPFGECCKSLAEAFIWMTACFPSGTSLKTVVSWSWPATPWRRWTAGERRSCGPESIRRGP